jgi:hypothetical protein
MFSWCEPSPVLLFTCYLCSHIRYLYFEVCIRAYSFGIIHSRFDRHFDVLITFDVYCKQIFKISVDSIYISCSVYFTVTQASLRNRYFKYLLRVFILFRVVCTLLSHRHVWEVPYYYCLCVWGLIYFLVRELQSSNVFTFTDWVYHVLCGSQWMVVRIYL